ncbi:ArsC/Spx/MgsR family protein [Donghicola mangrovi]|uniref:Arsenate reductase n=1 Tax=Donghicola mangrovi TaxID=2729614 RepID=A0A850Q2V7_9RHOB|nr:ArsC/Spx/MgsR family protein [Donghicola mangrovi]NVO23436.1 arsenate reductase [Donghicola mangrovi]
MNLYGLKTCDTCRKAAKALPDANYIDVRKDGVPAEVLSAAYDVFGDKLVNKSSTTWRGLDEAERARPALELLAEHPTLMKRPLITRDGQMWLGWTKDVQAELA